MGDKKQKIELEKKRQEHVEILKKQQEKKESEINNIKLKYLKENMEKIKEDLIFKEKQEKLLHKKKRHMLNSSNFKNNKGDIHQLRENIMTLNNPQTNLNQITNKNDNKLITGKDQING